MPRADNSRGVNGLMGERSAVGAHERCRYVQLDHADTSRPSRAERSSCARSGARVRGGERRTTPGSLLVPTRTPALKRARIAQADATPDAMPTFVPVDFETTSLTDGLGATAFDPKRPSVVSWMNTLPYLSPSAIEATLRELVALTAPGSRIALNYSPDVPLTDEQIAYLQTLRDRVSQAGEPMRSRWKPAAFEALLDEVGFAIIDHASEQDLYARYFEGRRDGLKPGVPARLIVVEPRSSGG